MVENFSESSKSIDTRKPALIQSNDQERQIGTDSNSSFEKQGLVSELKRSEQKLRHLFDYANDSIIIVNPITGQFLDCNLNAHKRLGYSKDELLQLTVADIHDDLSLDDIKAIFDKQVMGHSVQFETIHKRKDGTYMPVELTSTLIAYGNITVIQTFIRDISKRRKVEEDKERLIDKLTKALDEIKTLKGIFPICSHCKKIRDDKGYWNQIESYISKHSQAEFSHSICQECAKKYYPDMDLYED